MSSLPSNIYHHTKLHNIMTETHLIIPSASARYRNEFIGESTHVSDESRRPSSSRLSLWFVPVSSGLSPGPAEPLLPASVSSPAPPETLSPPETHTGCQWRSATELIKKRVKLIQSGYLWETLSFWLESSLQFNLSDDVWISSSITGFSSTYILTSNTTLMNLNAQSKHWSFYYLH